MTLLKSVLEQTLQLYTKCYCEENIYHLVKSLRNVPDLGDIYAVFISNGTRSIPIWSQKTAQSDQPVIWDYHVICVAKSSNDWLVFDFDSTLSLPTLFKDYVTHALKPNIKLQSQFTRSYRIISGPEYVKRFASDRSHMVIIR